MKILRGGTGAAAVVARSSAGVLVVAVLAVASACGSSGTTDTAGAPSASAGGAAGQPGTTAGASTYEIVPDATVTAGLTDVRARAATIKAALATNQAEAQALTKAMYDKWFSFEGTVRKSEKSLYLQMEDGLAAIKAGVEQNNMTKVDKGIKDLEEGASGYLAKHPG